MKYRIITNGKRFRIQYRCFLFFYFDVIENKPIRANGTFRGMIKGNAEFSTLDQAIEWIHNEQPPKEPKETWRVVDMDAPRLKPIKTTSNKVEPVRPIPAAPVDSPPSVAPPLITDH